MKTDRHIDDTSRPIVHTAFARVFMPPQPPVTPEGVDVLVTARDRLHEPEVIRVAAFCAIWSLMATGCFLPWGGDGWWMALRAVVCLGIWLPIWAVAMQLIVVVPGALCAALESRRVLSNQESLTLATALAVLIFTVAAFLLLASPSLVCQIVGDIWLFALVLEGLLRVVLLIGKLLK